MLGYVQIHKPELKVREYEIYTGYYCGICKYIGREYGQLPRMALSYDAAFLALMLASVSEEPDMPVQEHCVAHHIKKKTIVRNTAIEYAGDVMLILAWYNLLDDAHDEGKTSAKALTFFMKGIYRKLRRKHPELCTGVEEHLKELSSLEEAKCSSLDQAAEAFSKIMEVIFYQGAPKESREIFAGLGYHIGKWIYLMDAVDDIEEDIESGAYNPLLYRYDYRGMVSGDTSLSEETPEDFRDRIRDKLEFNLFHYLAVLADEAEKLDIRKNKGIIDNVIYFGLNRKTETVLEQSTETEQENPNESI